MKKLLEDIQRVLDSVPSSSVYDLPRGFLESVEARIEAQLAALHPEAGHAEAILAHADGLEDEGDWRARVVRSAFSENPPKEALLAVVDGKIRMAEDEFRVSVDVATNLIVAGDTNVVFQNLPD